MDDNEWKAVFAWLFSEDMDSKRAGVSRVAAWRARGNIPTPVEATADIIDSQIAEKDGGSAGLTDRPQSLMYSMAITR